MPDSLPGSDGAVRESLHLRDYWNVLRRRRGLAFLVLLLVVGLGVARVYLIRPLYWSTAQILIERNVPNVLDFDRNARVNDALEDFYQTQYRLLQSRLLARKVVERLHLLDDPEFGGPRAVDDIETAESAAPGASPDMEGAIDDFLLRLKIQPVKNSQLVAIGFLSSRPELAAEAPNALADEYIQQTLDFRYRVSAEAGSWLATQGKEQTQKVEAAELALQKFKESEGLVSIEERRTLLEQKLKDLGSSLTAAKTRRLDKEALYRQMQTASSAEELPEVLQSPVVQSLRSELATLERQGAQLAAKGYLDDHPEVVRLRQQIDGTRQKIAIEARRVIRAAENDYRVAAAQEASSAEALEAVKREALDLSQRGLKYDALKRDLETSRTLADNINTRQKQTDVARDVQASNIHVIDPAIVPAKPMRPQPVRDIGLSILLGLGCAIAAAFLRDYFDSSVGRPSDVRRLGLPLLGVIPETRARRTPLVVTNGHRKEPFAEGYRVLRTALDPVTAEDPGQVLLVTSTLQGEGKSLTSVNLALTLSSTDERVLLIDGDLRRPALNTLLQTRRAPGLSEVLTGVASIEQAVVRVAGTRLSLLPSGTAITYNPADLLASGGLRELLATLRGRYDRIVIDTPPAGAIADTLVLSPLADGVLVVARSGKVTRNDLGHVLERLANARAPLLGVVLNRARPDKDRFEYGLYFSPDAFADKGLRRLPAPAPPRSNPPRRTH
jgi:succinoglycan biosynthesis transport protein ExoP